MGKTLYAVIQPPAPFDGSIIDTFAYAFVTAYHRAMYDNFHGYSLGNKMYFHDTLEEAKDHVFPSTGIRGTVDGLYRDNSRNAVVELEVQNETVINVKRIHEIKAFQPTDFRGERVMQAVWFDQELREDIDEKILDTFTDKLQLRYYQPHYKDSNHPKAKICSELSKQFEEENGPCAPPELLSKIDLLHGLSISTLALSLVITAINPESLVDFVPQLLSFGSLLAGTSAHVHSNQIESKQKEKEAYIKNGLFSPQHKEYTGPMTRSRKKAQESVIEPPRLAYQ